MKKGLEGAKGNEIKAVAGKLADAESMVALKVGSQSLPDVREKLHLLTPCEGMAAYAREGNDCEGFLAFMARSVCKMVALGQQCAD